MAEGVSILVVLSVEFSYRSVTVMIWQVRCNFIGIKMEKYEGKEEQQQHGKKYFIEDFLLPSLNEGKFGYKLYWSDINKGEFKILWKDNRNHQNGEAEENSEVFTCWLQMKYGTTKIEKSYSKQKDTFRSCLHSKGKGKEEILERMEDDNEYRVYRFRNINIFKCKNMQQLEKCELPKAKIADESLPRHSFRLSHYSPKEAESDSGLGEEDNDTLSGSRSFNFMCQHTIEELKHIYLNGKKCEDEIFDDLDIMMDDDDIYKGQ